jgi:hypothetical protein
VCVQEEIAIDHAPALQDFEMPNLKDLLFQSIYSKSHIQVRETTLILEEKTRYETLSPAIAIAA